MEEERGATPNEQAVATLISINWLRGEATAQGISPSQTVVDDALDERREANGAAEFQRTLNGSGRTLDDLRLEVEAELAAAAIRRKVLRSIAATEPEIADYYKRHRALFREPELRTVDLVEGLPSAETASRLVRRIGTGPKFSKQAFHEELEIEPGVHLAADIERVMHAIFAAKQGVASRPMSLNRHWTVFVVRAIRPAKIKPLSKVHARIAARLVAAHRRAALDAFTAAFRNRWTARTSCGPGYVVQGCRQYKGPRRTQPNPFAPA
jgi:PPIC-type PPIASE domain